MKNIYLLISLGIIFSVGFSNTMVWADEAGDAAAAKAASDAATADIAGGLIPIVLPNGGTTPPVTPADTSTPPAGGGEVTPADSAAAGAATDPATAGASAANETETLNDTYTANNGAAGSNANEMETQNDAYTASNSAAASDGTIKIFTTEKIPGADCKCVAQTSGNNPSAATTSCSDVTTRKYECTVKPGLGSFQSLFASIIKYFINIVLILGVLAIAGLGVAWSWAGGDDVKAKSTLKKWGINIVVGLTILFLFQYILKFLAPWAFQ